MTLWRRLLPTLVFFAALLANGVPLCAQEAEFDDEQAVQTARDALSDRKSLPWYDAEKDDVRAIDVKVDDAGQFKNRQSRWQSTPANPRGGGGNNVNLPSFSFFEVLGQILYYLAIAVAIALIALLFYWLVRAYVQREESAAAVTTRAAVTEQDEDDTERIESLPFTVARPRGDLLDEAMAQYQAGNFRQAVVYLYSYLLIQLDRNQQIHLARGKTNRTYLRELREQPQLRSILERTMTAFEDVFFGNHALSRAEFEACWTQLDEFHKHVEQVAT
jgi:hypothetical protein